MLLHRRKLKPTHAERTLFGEGDGSDLKVVDSPLGRLGALNCFEHLQPLSNYALYAQNEQIHVAGWPCLGILGNVPALSPEAITAATLTYALEGGTFADIDLAAIDLAKNTVDPAGHYARADATRLVLDPRPRRPVIRPRDLTPDEFDLEPVGPVFQPLDPVAAGSRAAGRRDEDAPQSKKVRAHVQPV